MSYRISAWPLFPPETVSAWKPLVDVYRTRQGWILKFDLAGVRREDVTVSLRGRCVSVSGLRKDTIVEEGSSHYTMEISYNRFERTIEMPRDLDGAQITLEAREGNLLVRIVTEGN
jgi:HSP20 family protein